MRYKWYLLFHYSCSLTLTFMLGYSFVPDVRVNITVTLHDGINNRNSDVCLTACLDEKQRNIKAPHFLFFVMETASDRQTPSQGAAIRKTCPYRAVIIWLWLWRFFSFTCMYVLLPPIKSSLPHDIKRIMSNTHTRLCFVVIKGPFY